MSHVDENQPLGTPTWVDLAVNDPERAKQFYRELFGWEYVDLRGGHRRRIECLLDGRPVAGFTENHEAVAGERRWEVYLATDDCDATIQRAVAAGGTLVGAPEDVPGRGRTAVLRDPVGARFGLWQGRGHPGARVVNEPNAWVRNDLVTPAPEPARSFYAAVFDFTLDGNDDLPGVDFTFLRRPDGHEIGGIMGDPGASASVWGTAFAVADTDATVKVAREAGGKAGAPEDHPYARMASITDPLGTEFDVGAQPAG